MKKQNETHQFRAWQTLRWRLTLFVFAILLIAGILTACMLILIHALFSFSPWLLAVTTNPIFLSVVILCVSALLGTILTGILGVYYLRPLKELRRATKEVKKGNFTVQVKTDGNQEDEMGELIDSFNEMVRELDGIEVFRKDFINNFSHEFKTPIVSIRGFAKELQREDLSPEMRREYASIIAEESDRLARLSINILELSKLENQQFVSEKSEFYLDEQLRRCILLLEPSWSEKELEMIPELEEVKIYSSEEILSHIWKNLLSNAIKFTPRGGSVFVTLRADENEVQVTIRDTGIGMDEETKRHIFEKFYQGDPSHHRTGYGIGLSMVDRAIKLSGGSISVESEPEKGSTFTVRLPRTTPMHAEIVEIS